MQKIFNCCKKKTIFNFFKISDCENCYHLRKNDEIKIGDRSIYLYYLRECDYIIKDVDYLFLLSCKVRLFLKDCIINEKIVIPLILEELKFSYNDYNMMEVLIGLGNDIHILII